MILELARPTTKQDLRQRLVAERSAMEPWDVKQRSARVCRSILELPEFERASAVALYCAFANEVDLETLAHDCERQGKRMLLPRFDGAAGLYEMVWIEAWDADRVPGRFGIFEPDTRCAVASSGYLEEQSVLWLVPGVGFDRDGNRLGFGKGYYDRLLADVRGCRVGVCHDFQVVDSIPSTATDVPMNLIVSDQEVCRIDSSV
jgi:5-formyltetrahydrofolate cyclo-ligase